MYLALKNSVFTVRNMARASKRHTNLKTYLQDYSFFSPNLLLYQRDIIQVGRKSSSEQDQPAFLNKKGQETVVDIDMKFTGNATKLINLLEN